MDDFPINLEDAPSGLSQASGHSPTQGMSRDRRRKHKRSRAECLNAAFQSDISARPAKPEIVRKR